MFRLIYVIILIAYLQGLIQTFANPSIAKYLLEPLFIILFFFALNYKFRLTPFFISFVIFLSVFITSCYIHDDFNQAAFTFFKPFIYSFLIFYSSYKADFTETELRKLFKLLFFLVLIQLPAAIIKVGIYGGFAEKSVGTISYSGGSLHLIFPMMVIGYLLGFYYYAYPKKKLLYFVLFFMIFGITGAKKGVPFYILGLIAVSYLVYMLYTLKKTINFGKIFASLIGGFFLFYFSVMLIPGLNKEKAIGGSFDFEWLQDKIYSYSFYDEKKDIYQGRFGGTKVLVDDLFGETRKYIIKKQLKTTLFGYMPSSFDESSYLTGNENVNEDHNRIIPTGFFKMLFSLGIFGVLGFMLFYGSIFMYCRKMFLKKFHYFAPFGKALVFGSLMFTLVIFLDFFTYSQLYTYSTIYVTFFFILGQIFRYRPNQSLIFINNKAQNE